MRFVSSSPASAQKNWKGWACLQWQLGSCRTTGPFKGASTSEGRGQTQHSPTNPLFGANQNSPPAPIGLSSPAKNLASALSQAESTSKFASEPQRPATPFDNHDGLIHYRHNGELDRVAARPSGRRTHSFEMSTFWLTGVFSVPIGDQAQPADSQQP